jgi:hypothetical protein
MSQKNKVSIILFPILIINNATNLTLLIIKIGYY